jgi:F420-dependent oxidoreductase-like protein
MKLGLHIDSYTWAGDPAGLGSTMRRIASTAEEIGFARLSVTDHVWQNSAHGEEGDPMLEAYTTLGFLACATRSAELLALVSPATYRPPGLLAKIVTTLDVLSGGRAMLGIGAGWNEEEATGLGLEFASTPVRFEWLEEALRICLQMFSADDGPFRGRHYTLSSTLNSPPPVSKPRPRIVLGGAGERLTLRLVARYADACNIYGGPDAGHKLQLLREHCEREGRDYNAIEKTAILSLDSAGDGGVERLLHQLRALHELGFESVLGAVPDVETITPLETLGTKVLPEVAAW